MDINVDLNKFCNFCDWFEFDKNDLKALCSRKGTKAIIKNTKGIIDVNARGGLSFLIFKPDECLNYKPNKNKKSKYQLMNQ